MKHWDPKLFYFPSHFWQRKIVPRWSIQVGGRGEKRRTPHSRQTPSVFVTIWSGNGESFYLGFALKSFFFSIVKCVRGDFNASWTLNRSNLISYRESEEFCPHFKFPGDLGNLSSHSGIAFRSYYHFSHYGVVCVTTFTVCNEGGTSIFASTSSWLFSPL